MTRISATTNTETVLAHCEAMGLSVSDLASALAVNPRTVQRWRDGSAQPNEASLRALEKMDGIYELAAGLFRADALEAWVRSPNETLSGERPLDLLRRGELERVRNVLGMLEWGIYA